jgi:hypothetical protein
MCGLAFGQRDRTIFGLHDIHWRVALGGHRSVIIPVIAAHSTQVVLVDCFADSQPQQRSCVLVGSKMYSAINASVGDVIGNLRE